jgi:hypothetical protein
MCKQKLMGKQKKREAGPPCTAHALPLGARWLTPEVFSTRESLSHSGATESILRRNLPAGMPVL